MIDLEQVKRGRKEPRIGIIEQLAVLIALATRHAAKLERWDWPPAKTEKMRAIHARLQSDLGAQAEAKDRARVGTVSQTMALSRAKAFKRQLERALRRVFRAREGGEISPALFEVGAPIGLSVPRMVAYLARIAPGVATLAPVLAPKMGGIDPVAELERTRSALESADVTQELALTDLPQETLEIYEAKGMALELIADLIDAGHSAFDDDATEAAKFNKDIIVRARKTRPVQAPPQ